MDTVDRPCKLNASDLLAGVWRLVSAGRPSDSAMKALQQATRSRRRVGALIIGSTVLPQIVPESRRSGVSIDIQGHINGHQVPREVWGSTASSECTRPDNTPRELGGSHATEQS